MQKILTLSAEHSNESTFEGLKDELELILFRARNNHDTISDYDKNEVDGYKVLDAVVDIDKDTRLPSCITISNLNKSFLS